jgi:hypothetical protein
MTGVTFVIWSRSRLRIMVTKGLLVVALALALALASAISSFCSVRTAIYVVTIGKLGHWSRDNRISRRFVYFACRIRKNAIP